MADIDLTERVSAIAARAKDRREAAERERAEAQSAREARRESVKNELREAMPEVAAVVDQLREVFGQDVKLLAAEENGRSVRSEKRLDELGLK